MSSTLVSGEAPKGMPPAPSKAPKRPAEEQLTNPRSEKRRRKDKVPQDITQLQFDASVIPYFPKDDRASYMMYGRHTSPQKLVERWVGQPFCNVDGSIIYQGESAWTEGDKAFLRLVRRKGEPNLPQTITVDPPRIQSDEMLPSILFKLGEDDTTVRLELDYAPCVEVRKALNVSLFPPGYCYNINCLSSMEESDCDDGEDEGEENSKCIELGVLFLDKRQHECYNEMSYDVILHCLCEYIEDAHGLMFEEIPEGNGKRQRTAPYDVDVRFML